MDGITNRRRYERHSVLYSAKYIVRSGTHRDLIGNISAGGIFIYTRRDITSGQRITLRFPIVAFDQKPSVSGTVVRSQAKGFAVMFDCPIKDDIPTSILTPDLHDPPAACRSLSIAQD
jgi:hypothetical protein